MLSGGIPNVVIVSSHATAESYLYFLFVLWKVPALTDSCQPLIGAIHKCLPSSSFSPALVFTNLSYIVASLHS